MNWQPISPTLAAQTHSKGVTRTLDGVDVTVWVDVPPHSEQPHVTITTSTGGDTDTTATWSIVEQVMSRETWPTQIKVKTRNNAPRRVDPELQNWVDQAVAELIDS